MSINFKRYGFKSMAEFCVKGLTDPCFLIGHKKVSLLQQDVDLNSPPVPISDSVAERIKAVLATLSNGVQDSELNIVLRRGCGLFLDPVRYNFLSLRALLAHNKHLFYVDHNWRVYSQARRPVQRVTMYAMNQSVRGALLVGKIYPIVWSVMCGPNLFWFLPQEALEELDTMTVELNRHYERDHERLRLRQTIEKDTLVVVKTQINFCRARVIEVEGDKYKVWTLLAK